MMAGWLLSNATFLHPISCFSLCNLGQTVFQVFFIAFTGRRCSCFSSFTLPPSSFRQCASGRAASVFLRLQSFTGERTELGFSPAAPHVGCALSPEIDYDSPLDGDVHGKVFEALNIFKGFQAI
ncbi:hypothetical protein L1987_83811 [Smallanthus sonchifolius]|uniref:Uncharacterized protein n=1 Tax=Smallanthus sonchifolius TaxID=185202 RepID=A0ACB8YDW6_9ASTR|nr:hypothetical protein L1987_83811 [Smallanthus sonchifolius]